MYLVYRGLCGNKGKVLLPPQATVTLTRGAVSVCDTLRCFGADSRRIFSGGVTTGIEVLLREKALSVDCRKKVFVERGGTGGGGLAAQPGRRRRVMDQLQQCRCCSVYAETEKDIEAVKGMIEGGGGVKVSLSEKEGVLMEIDYVALSSGVGGGRQMAVAAWKAKARLMRNGISMDCGPKPLVECF